VGARGAEHRRLHGRRPGARETLATVSPTWKWRARAETAGTTVNVGNLAIAVLQLEATPAMRRRWSREVDPDFGTRGLIGTKPAPS
jgi:hypothetical protein